MQYNKILSSIHSIKINKLSIQYSFLWVLQQKKTLSYVYYYISYVRDVQALINETCLFPCSPNCNHHVALLGWLMPGVANDEEAAAVSTVVVAL